MADVTAKFIHTDERHSRLTPYPKEPGEFRFENMDREAVPPPEKGQVGRFNFGCVKGGQNCGSIIIGNGFKPNIQGRPTWEWDGNVENPTLKPSINCLSHNPNDPSEAYAGCGWHGWLTSGKFTNAG